MLQNICSGRVSIGITFYRKNISKGFTHLNQGVRGSELMQKHPASWPRWKLSKKLSGVYFSRLLWYNSPYTEATRKPPGPCVCFNGPAARVPVNERSIHFMCSFSVLISHAFGNYEWKGFYYRMTELFCFSDFRNCFSCKVCFGWLGRDKGPVAADGMVTDPFNPLDILIGAEALRCFAFLVGRKKIKNPNEATFITTAS